MEERWKMKKIRGLLIIIFLFLAGCSGKGQTIFYWRKDGVGPTWFAKEHNECLAEADYCPWQWPAWPPGTSQEKNLRFDNDADNGIWANFVPYDGAMPVYVNSLVNDGTMSPSVYRNCMLSKGYIERQPSVVRRQVLPE